MKPLPATCLLLLTVIAWNSIVPQAAATPAAQTAAPQASTSPASGAGAAAETLASQEPVATLKVSTRVVAISAVVTGKQGEPTGGLTKDDFILKQDGREEPIRYFSQGSELPLTIALMVDTSGSQRTLISDEVLASDVFFETMLGRPEDRAALIQFDARVLQIKGLTSSPDELHLALLSLHADPKFEGATLLNDAVDAVARRILAKETGRKAMILLTDGGDAGSRTPIAKAIEQAERSDIQIYSIVYTAQNDPGGANGQHTRSPDQGVALLQSLSESTGGHVFTVSPRMSLREIFARIAQDLRLEYELGYTPPPDTPPNSYHKLELKTRDRKLTAQARKGFFAPP